MQLREAEHVWLRVSGDDIVSEFYASDSDGD